MSALRLSRMEKSSAARASSSVRWLFSLVRVTIIMDDRLFSDYNLSILSWSSSHLRHLVFLSLTFPSWTIFCTLSSTSRSLSFLMRSISASRDFSRSEPPVCSMMSLISWRRSFWVRGDGIRRAFVRWWPSWGSSLGAWAGIRGLCTRSAPWWSGRAIVGAGALSSKARIRGLCFQLIGTLTNYFNI